MKTNTKTKKSLLISALGLVTLLTGCYTMQRPLLIWAYGIHQPRVENKESLICSARKYGLEPGRIVSVSPVAYQDVLGRFYHSMPEAVIFDKQGRRIEYKAKQVDCNAGLFSFIPQLSRHGDYRRNSEFTLNDFAGHLLDLSGKALPAGYFDSSADYYLFISWADYTGKLNKDHVSVWQKLAEKNNNAKIQVVEVNFDVQDWWPANEKNLVLAKASL